MLVARMERSVIRGNLAGGAIPDFACAPSRLQDYASAIPTAHSANA